MWVSTSLSLALNLLPHQVRSAFQLSIRPPSSRMKRKFPCSAQNGTSSGLTRYSFIAGSKEWAEQRRRQAATKPISPTFFADTDTRGFLPTELQAIISASSLIIITRSFPLFAGKLGTENLSESRWIEPTKSLGNYGHYCRESIPSLHWAAQKIDQLERSPKLLQANRN